MAVIIGFVGTGCTMISYMSVLPRWFSAKLGTSFAFAVSGIGIGQFAMPFYANWLLHALGWRLAYIALAISVLVITVPNAVFLLRDAPQSHRSVAALDDAKSNGISYQQALRMPVFWRLAALVLLVTIATTAFMVHIVPLLTDRGVHTADATSAAAFMGIAALAGRFVVGVLLDYLNAALLGFLSFAGCAAGVLLIASGIHGVPVYLGVILVGVGLGAENDLLPFVVRRVFGIRSYSTIYGSLFVAFTVGLVIGPLLLGFAFDVSGNYDLGLQIVFTLATIAALLWLPGLPVATSSTRTAA
ncbi:major Facilitator Superfamily protein [Burkholderia cenocepacia]|uniref:Major Facilitator Superfamily protein n=1 Tax=Burkholderia cenocepacia TaxID=95486 RepID=A0AAN0RT08_9BURK|nr:major Facilitator Superfamily protein [Burkholderia cenocepacia]